MGEVLVLFLLLFFTKDVFSANVLCVSGVISPSHHIWHRALSLGLVGKGHNVTLIGPDEDNTPPTRNFTHILMEGAYDDHEDSFNDMAAFSVSTMITLFQDWSIHQCKKFYESKGFHKLWNYPDDFRFDVIITDITTGTCMLPLIERFKFPPTVATTPFLLPPYVSYNFGNHLHSSFIPWYLFAYSTDMSFTQRVRNFFHTIYDVYLRHTYEYNVYDKIARETLGDQIKANWQQLERHITIVLANTDPILDVPQPLTPNIIPTGGLHTRKSRNLPGDLQDVLDKAKNGVIVFSLGTNVKSDQLSEEHKKALLEAFSKLDELIVWKFESEINDLPKNVIVRKFLPQNDILGHPNVKLFIGHGGALSTQEAIFHGVPMMVIPFCFDQLLNAKAVERKKIGIAIDLNQIGRAGYVLDNLKEVLTNPLYTENMRLASKRFRDQPETPLQRGIFWIEYAMRHNGADFLNSPARDMPWYRSSSADVVAFLIVIFFGMVIVIKKGMRNSKTKMKTD